MSIGIIGGSGLYDWDLLEEPVWMDVNTPWGEPSDQMLCGRLAGKTIYFLPRHGRGHRWLPSEINHRANIYALKQADVEAILSVSAVGSLREDIRPRDVLIPDQYFDRTRNTPQHTFFGCGIAAHISMADPICPFMRTTLLEAAQAARAAEPDFADRRIHDGGTYVNMEGPAFSTRAESDFFRRQGFEIIGMTSLPEARLAREAELPYATLSLITDYDCWHTEQGPVTADLVSGHVRANKTFAQSILVHFIERLPDVFPSPAHSALAGAIMTDPQYIPETVRQRIPWI
jgi:5'-methylthioadenosine phosphorylase